MNPRQHPGRRPVLAGVLGALLVTASDETRAEVVTEAPRVYSVAYTLEDDQSVPVGFPLVLTDSAIRSVTRVEVGLVLRGVDGVGGFAGEMFVSLSQILDGDSVADIRTANLLNGVGISSGNPFGYGYNGWDATFSDEAAGGDVHEATLLDGILTGAFQPDGRVSPTDTARPLTLSVLEGRDGNGTWRLNVADLELGGRMRLESWSLTLTGETAVPEPSTCGAAVALGSGIVWRWRRRRRTGR